MSIILRRQKTFPKPFKVGFPNNPKSIGEHIRRKRMELGLYQSDVAKLFNVSADCITYWENNRSKPQVNYYPRIIEFLGYFPFKLDASILSGKLKVYRYKNGLSQKNMAKFLNADPSTIASWERGEFMPHKEKLKKLELLLATKPLE